MFIKRIFLNNNLKSLIPLFPYSLKKGLTMTEKKYHGYKIEGVGKGKADYYVYTDLCKGCGLCIAKCPMNKAGKECLQWSKEVGLYQTPAVAPNPEICIACGACAMTCPDSAIRIEKRQ